MCIEKCWCAIQVILDRKNVQEIPDTLCRGKRIFVVVEGCWSCGITSHLAKMYPSQNSISQPVTSKEVVEDKVPDGPGELGGGGEKVVEDCYPSYFAPEGYPTGIAEGATAKAAGEGQNSAPTTKTAAAAMRSSGVATVEPLHGGRNQCTRCKR